MGANDLIFGGGLGVVASSLTQKQKDEYRTVLGAMYPEAESDKINALIETIEKLDKKQIDFLIEAIHKKETSIIYDYLLKKFKKKPKIENNIPKVIEPKHETPNEQVDWADPRSIKGYLDKYVSGQEEAKKVLSVAFSDYISYGTISHSLLIGPTGSGKTYILKVLCEAAGIPFVKISMANVTSAGYKNENLSEKIQVLRGKERAIVFLDEFDKLSPTEEGRGTSGFTERLQKELLSYFSGDKIDGIDSSKFLIVTAGAFNGGFGQQSLSSMIQKRLGGNKARVDESEVLSQVTNDDLVRYGIMPELVGRLANKAVLEPLDEEALYKILAHTENSILKQKVKDFAKMGITLEFEDEAIRLIARNSAKGVGARGLESIINELVGKYSFNRADYKGEKITISPNEVEELMKKEVKFEKVDDIKVDWTSPKSIVAYMDFYAVGQEEAKKSLSTSFMLYSKKLANPDLPLPQPNSLLIGPSGSGKTYLVELLAKKAQIPVSKINLAEGISVAEFRARLADLVYNGKGIVFLDEADKVLLDPYSPFRKELIGCLENGEVNGVDLSGIMFVLAGAFQGLFEKKVEDSGSSIGFGAQVEKTNNYKGVEINTDTLIEAGVPIEVLGRVPNIVPLQPLGVNELVEMMKKPGSELEKFINYFKSENVELIISEPVLLMIATKAKAKLGARSIKPILSKLFNPFIQDIENYRGEKLEIKVEDIS
ncbi:AAA family ATPase [Candidatus Gracilibacteria bacterium]|nr:AAA family ATPase [Candidatus Gracilibacteria bacterium]